MVDPLPGVIDGSEVQGRMEPGDIIRSIPNAPQYRPEVEIPEHLPRSNSPTVRALDLPSLRSVSDRDAHTCHFCLLRVRLWQLRTYFL